MQRLCTSNQECPYTHVLNNCEGEGALSADAVCNQTEPLCPTCSLLDARVEMKENIREPRNFAFLLKVALPVSRIVSEIEGNKEKIFELSSEFLNVWERRLLINLGSVQSIADGLRDVLPKKFTEFLNVFSALGGTINESNWFSSCGRAQFRTISQTRINLKISKNGPSPPNQTFGVLA